MSTDEFNNYYKKIENQLKEELQIEKISPNDFKNYSLKYLKKLAEFLNIELKLRDNSYDNITNKNMSIFMTILKKGLKKYQLKALEGFSSKVINLSSIDMGVFLHHTFILKQIDLDSLALNPNPDQEEQLEMMIAKLFKEFCPNLSSNDSAETLIESVQLIERSNITENVVNNIVEVSSTKENTTVPEEVIDTLFFNQDMELNSRNETINHSESEIRRKSTNSEDKKKEIDNLKDQMKILMEKFNHSEEKNAKVFDEVRTENNSLRTDVDELKKENNSIKKENNSIKKDNNSLRTDVDELKKENNSIKKENNSIKKDNNSIKKENNSLRTDVDELKKENKSLREEFKIENNQLLKRISNLEIKFYASNTREIIKVIFDALRDLSPNKHLEYLSEEQIINELKEKILILTNYPEKLPELLKKLSKIKKWAHYLVHGISKFNLDLLIEHINSKNYYPNLFDDEVEIFEKLIREMFSDEEKDMIELSNPNDTTLTDLTQSRFDRLKEKIKDFFNL